VNLPDDTELDALAAQARAYPPLDDAEVARLLAEAVTAGPARERLVEHHLSIALDEAIARGGRGVAVADLYQEGTLATIVAVSEYASRGGTPSGLRAFVARVVGAHLESAIEEAALEQRSDEAFVRDAQLYEAAEINLRRELGRSATTMELAAALLWPEDRVAVVAEMLNAAREMYDSEIVQYLDDDD
jgi:DNA-directed RNA polymerase sigma subunit (sigma70/sigma32)